MVPTRRALVTVWLAAVVAMGAVLVVSRATQTPGDDLDPARQRPGILDLGPLPVAAPTLSDGVPAPGEPTVVFFAGSQAAALCAELPDADLDDVAVVEILLQVGGESGRPQFQARVGVACRETREHRVLVE